MTQIDALKLALEALEFVNQTGDTQTFDMCYAKPALAAIKEALAQPEQEPVKDWIASHNEICALLRQAHDALALTSYPPRRTWVGLTDEDRAEILNRKWWNFEDEFDVDGFLRLAEAKLKELNT